MTTPAVKPINTGHIMAELQIGNPSRTYPLNLNDADARALAGVPSGPISMDNFLNKSGGSSLAATTTNGSGSFSSAGGPGTATCNPSVSAFNGTPPYSYLWTFTSNPDTCSLSNATSAACTVSKGFAALSGGSANATLNCRITDNIGTIINKPGITASLIWDSGA